METQKRQRNIQKYLSRFALLLLPELNDQAAARDGRVVLEI